MHSFFSFSYVHSYVRLVYKSLVLICMANLLGEKNIVPWLISRLISWLIMAAEQSPYNKEIGFDSADSDPVTVNILTHCISDLRDTYSGLRSFSLRTV